MEETYIDFALFKLLKSRFQEHLLEPANQRTIFSGKFGSGKTIFLNDFFKENKSLFLPIVLHPVNYSIASNEDIFEYIKYDILLELLPHLDLSKF